MATVNGQLEEREGADVSAPRWPRLLSVELAAEYLSISPKTLANHRYQLPGLRKWGNKIVFDRLVLDRMLDHSGGRRSLWVDAERLCP